MSRNLKTHYRPGGRGRTACGLPAKQSKTDTGKYQQCTCKNCRRTVRAWARWAKDLGFGHLLPKGVAQG